jgi:uncharacterized protein (DUF983 family)
MSSQPPPFPPSQPIEYASRAGCPKCGSGNCTPITFTWWGGVLGPKLMNHTKCNQCGSTFNRKTGKSNGTAILIYNLVGLAIGIVAFFVFFRLMR